MIAMKDGIRMIYPNAFEVRSAALNEDGYVEVSPVLLADKMASNDWGKGSPYSSS